VESAIAKKLIMKHCKERLDRFKVPTEIRIKSSMVVSDRFKKKR
jgi:hypothetical protein